MELKDIKEFIEKNGDNEELNNYIGGFVTSDRVEKFLESEDGRKILQPRLDKYHSKGLESWKDKNLNSIVEAEITKKFPAETEEKKQLRIMKEELEQIKSEKLRETLKNKALTVTTEKKLPSGLIDFFLGSDEQSTLENLTVFEEVFNSHIQSAVEERLKGNSYTPPSGDKNSNITKEDVQKMTYRDRIQFQKDNPELYKKLAK